MDIYPYLGILLAKQNSLHIKGVPFSIPIPYYPHKTKSQSVLDEMTYLPKIERIPYKEPTQFIKYLT